MSLVADGATSSEADNEGLGDLGVRAVDEREAEREVVTSVASALRKRAAAAREQQIEVEAELSKLYEWLRRQRRTNGVRGSDFSWPDGKAKSAVARREKLLDDVAPEFRQQASAVLLRTSELVARRKRLLREARELDASLLALRPDDHAGETHDQFLVRTGAATPFGATQSVSRPVLTGWDAFTAAEKNVDADALSIPRRLRASAEEGGEESCDQPGQAYAAPGAPGAAGAKDDGGIDGVQGVWSEVEGVLDDGSGAGKASSKVVLDDFDELGTEREGLEFPRGPGTDVEEDASRGVVELEQEEQEDVVEACLDAGDVEDDEEAGSESDTVGPLLAAEDVAMEGKSLYVDDGDPVMYDERLAAWRASGKVSLIELERRQHMVEQQRKRARRAAAMAARKRPRRDDGKADVGASSGDEDEIHVPPPAEDVVFEGGLILPGEVCSSLFPFQRTGVKWLWELHCQLVGGIIGDEMGLGKTITTVAFLASLHRSRLFKTSLVVVPATVLKQWTVEFHRWWPPFRVVILHDCGASTGSKAAVVKDVMSKGDICLTTYGHVRKYSELLLPRLWGYVVLDEGHKIRNPDAHITLLCKQFRTAHRIVLTGAPIQNRLAELWSLLDFVAPGKLGTLPIFRAHFEIPIAVGGYANASIGAARAAYRCACVLRDTIAPYLLRRLKRDVGIQLPGMTEQVLFCRLTKWQRCLYEAFIHSPEIIDAYSHKGPCFRAIHVLRSICNHPDLMPDVARYAKHAAKLMGRDPEDEPVGFEERSGKMHVLRKLLRVWHSGGHRTLLFGQTRLMLDLLEGMVRQEGYSYRRLDGLTAVRRRAAIIRDFNSTPSISVFVLTTRVGGVGINLTTADRVVVFDPDWNPTTDTQARERAWRIGQRRPVRVLRLITSGTIEEKIYHRQIFKQLMANQILKDPSQRRAFRFSDLRDLFSLGPEAQGGATETSFIFGDAASEAVAVACEEQGEAENINQMLPSVPRRPQNGRRRRRDGGDGDGGDGGDGDDVDVDGGSGHGGAVSSQGAEEPLMKELLRATGVQSVFSHDMVVGEDKQGQTVRGILADSVDEAESEARKFAARAAAQLRASRRRRAAEDVHVPTWTGRSGTAGAPPAFLQAKVEEGSSSRNVLVAQGMHRGLVNFPDGGAPDPEEERGGFVRRRQGFSESSHSARAPMSSRVLLARMATRQMGSSAVEEFSEEAEEIVGRPAMITRMRDYLASCPQMRASTSEIVAAFHLRITPQDAAVFRRMLRTIARFEREKDGAGWWALNDDYR